MTRLTMFPTLLLLGLAACAGPHPPPVGAPEVTVASSADLPEALGARAGTASGASSPLTPGEMYAACRDRLEGEQSSGECMVDADCGRAGCSQEVCLPARKAGDVVTTCEILPCFRAVETCGCHEGQCTWTVRADLPPAGRRPGADAPGLEAPGSGAPAAGDTDVQ